MKPDARSTRTAAAVATSLALLIFAGSFAAGAPLAAFDRQEARAAQARLARGWNTWDSRNVLAWVLLPEAFSISLDFKDFTWIGDEHLTRALIGRKGEDVEVVRPGWHTLDGGYATLELSWRRVHARVEAAHAGEDLVLLVTPLDTATPAPMLVVESGLLWNASGALARVGSTLEARLAGRRLRVFTTGAHVQEPFAPAKTPYLALAFDGPIGISTGRPRGLPEIRRILDARRARLEEGVRRGREPAESRQAMESALAWNTIYEPRHRRVVTTVGRLWNEEYGGYCLFGWDNFLLAYAAGLFSRDLAVANFVEHLRSRTDEGFIPNDDRGNGTKSWDHSQPPVGSLMLKELYRRFPERWLLEASFDDLLAWNRWWMKARMNDGLLAYGSHPARNPYGQPGVHAKTTAGYESGMDDSPMYEDVPFNGERNTLELQDVGLTSLHIADSRALAEIAVLLGRSEEARELTERANALSSRLETLWDEETGLYLNRRTDSGALSRRLSPTLFYPLLARVPEPRRAERIVAEHFFNPEEFYGEFMLPSIARNDPAFPKQKYWKGAVWPPLNLLVYLGLRNYGMDRAARELAAKSQALFLAEWRRKGYVSENYSALQGTGDDERLSSDAFHTWGALMGLPALIEDGTLAPPERPLTAVTGR